MHYREIHKALVAKNDDPEKRGRIRVKSQTIGAHDVELPFWVEPIFPFTSDTEAGWFMVPEVGSEVELEIVVGADSDDIMGESFLIEPDAHYRAGAYTAANKAPAEFATNYPLRRGLKTPGGHVLVFDDKPGSELMWLQNVLGHYLKFNPDKGLKMSTATGGAYFEMKDASDAITKATRVFLGAADAVEQLVMGTTYRAHETTENTAISAQLKTIAAQLAIIASQLGVAGAAITAAGASLTVAGGDPLFAAVAPVAAPAVAAAGASLTAGGPGVVAAGVAAGAAGTAAGAAAAAIDAFEASTGLYLSAVSKTK